jgi:hypothetical protein
MLTTIQLSEMKNPILKALRLQDQIAALKNDLAAAEVEYNQIIMHCREEGYLKEAGYVISTRITTKRVIDPTLFANQFPEANAHLVQKQAAFLGTELDKLVSMKILPSIRVEDAKELVGNTLLDSACRFTVSEKTTVVKDDSA